MFAAPAERLLAQNREFSEYAAADIKYGSTIYTAQCSRCHGPEGDQIDGVNLRSGRFRQASSDSDLRRIITSGIPRTAMPPHTLDDAELVALVAYVRNMRDFDSRAVSLGDVAAGRSLFEGKGRCASCHRVNGRGPRAAPDLSDIGSIRSPGALEQILMDPTSMMAPVNRPVRLVTKDGTIIQGRRLNEDTYTIQIIDDQERLRSLSKATLRGYTILQTSGMPSFKGQFSQSELADLLAYLVSLKGALAR